MDGLWPSSRSPSSPESSKDPTSTTELPAQAAHAQVEPLAHQEDISLDESSSSYSWSDFATEDEADAPVGGPGRAPLQALPAAHDVFDLVALDDVDDDDDLEDNHDATLPTSLILLSEHVKVAPAVMDILTVESDTEPTDLEVLTEPTPEPALVESTDPEASKESTTVGELARTDPPAAPNIRGSEEAVASAATAAAVVGAGVAAAAGAPAAAAVAVGEAGAPEYYRGLGKRLEPFAQLAVPIGYDDVGQIRARITAIEHFRAEHVQLAEPARPEARPDLEDSGSPLCRICRDTAPPLVAPCECRGSVARVHVACLERWLAESDTSSCELCGHQYTTIRTPSYNVVSSIPAWILNNGGTDLIVDLVAFMIFTPVALFGTQIGLEANDGDYFQVTLMAAIDLVYSAWLTMRLHYHAICWYSWWRRKATVKVILDTDEYTDHLPDS